MEADEDFEHVLRRLERIGNAIMNRASGGAALTGDPVASILGDRDKRRAAAQILGQAYVTAYALIANNREPVQQIADTLIDRKEMHGDEVIDLLNSVGLRRPEVDLMDDRTWPKV
jgi:ATP-dependent Zn protease